jgi:hypothetical protein
MNEAKDDDEEDEDDDTISSWSLTASNLDGWLTSVVML